MSQATHNRADLAALATALKPYIVPWQSSQAGAAAPAAHALNGPSHTGALDPAQAPWAVAIDELAGLLAGSIIDSSTIGVTYDETAQTVTLDVIAALPPLGNLTGDIIRWNASTGAWESCSEPFAFKQIVLTPAAAAILNQEGSLWYKSTDKAIYVCTEEV